MFFEFYFPEQVKAIEKKDSSLTKEEQIRRLNRPGSTYFNLNPFEVSAISLSENGSIDASC